MSRPPSNLNAAARSYVQSLTERGADDPARWAETLRFADARHPSVGKNLRDARALAEREGWLAPLTDVTRPGEDEGGPPPAG